MLLLIRFGLLLRSAFPWRCVTPPPRSSAASLLRPVFSRLHYYWALLVSMTVAYSVGFGSLTFLIGITLGFRVTVWLVSHRSGAYTLGRVYGSSIGIFPGSLYTPGGVVLGVLLAAYLGSLCFCSGLRKSKVKDTGVERK